MGLFDSVYAGCPRCGHRIEFQSKADEDPYMNTYDVETAPTHILVDVLNDPHYCAKCGCWLALVDPAFPPERDQPRPSPTTVALREPNADEVQIHSTQPQYRWWNAPFSFSDIASGMAAPSGGETAQTGSTEGNSPTAAGGDAQPLSGD